nr:uncharacterized protein LOC111768179 [Equus caballus]
MHFGFILSFYKDLEICQVIPLSSSQSLKYASVKANFLRFVDKATAAAFSEASGLSVYLQECGRGEQATEGSRKRRRRRGKELGRRRRRWSLRRLGYVTPGAVLLKEKGGAELSAVPWRAAGRPQAGILVGSARGHGPSRLGCCGARCFYLCFVPLQGEPDLAGGHLPQALLTCHHPPSPTREKERVREKERERTREPRSLLSMPRTLLDPRKAVWRFRFSGV